MKRLFALLAGSITLLLLFSACIFALLHTPYLTPSAQWLASRLWSNRFTFSQLEYHYPLHFTFSNPVIHIDSQPIPFQRLDIWFNSALRKQGKWLIDSVLLDGGNLASGIPAYPHPQQWQINYLALHNIDLAEHGLIVRGVDLQIKRPQWQEKQQWLPYGELQLAAEQFYWQGEAINDFLINADYKPQNSTVYGASFEWNGATFSGQAEQYPSGWSLVNTTISQLTLTQPTLDSMLAWLKSTTPYIQHINSLDILNSHLSFNAMEMGNVNLSLENIDLQHSWWQQKQGYLSLNADMIEWQQLQWIEPAFKLEFTPQKIHIRDFSTQLLQGDIQLIGQVTPDRLHLEQLRANGIKWLDEPLPTPEWPDSLSHIAAITLNEFHLNNLQIIQLTKQPVWQLSGFNVEGDNLELMRRGQWGLWNGNMMISANSASIDDVIATQAIIEMSSQKGNWKLTRASLPLQRGYIDMTASWDVSKPSAPWQLDVHADGAPIHALHHWVDLPLKLEALADFDLQLSGLSGDYSIFAHSLSGKMQGSLRSGFLSFQQQERLIIQPFSLDHLQLSADRGRITISESSLLGPALQAQLAGEMDLLHPKQGKFELNLSQECASYQFDLLRNQQRNQPNTNCTSNH